MAEEVSNSDSIPEYNSYLKFKEYMPHKCHLLKLDEDNKFFINSALNCLTNINTFLTYLYNYNDIFNSSLYYKTLFNTVDSIYENLKENTYHFKPDEITKLILNNIKVFENKSNHDPRLLIDCILNFFLKVGKNNSEISISSLDFLNISESPNTDLTFVEYDLSKNNKFEDDKIMIVIKKEIKCPNLSCGKNSNVFKSFSTFHFYLSYDTNKEYTIYDYFNEFFQKEDKESEFKCTECSKLGKTESKNLFCKLPEDLIIFIYYDDEKKNYNDFYYKFDEIIDLTKYCWNEDDNNKNKNIINKRYFLSSLIACKCPKTEDEIFYTFCRKDKDSKFLIYYSDNNNVRDGVKNVNNKIIKLKTDQYDRKRGYPYVLVYSALKN